MKLIGLFILALLLVMTFTVAKEPAPKPTIPQADLYQYDPSHLPDQNIGMGKLFVFVY
jgi:hypothetical protein